MARAVTTMEPMTHQERQIVDRAKARRLVRDTPTLARSLRREAGLSLAEVGQALGVSHAAVQRWENGKRVPRGDLAERYLGLLRRAAGDE